MYESIVALATSRLAVAGLLAYSAIRTKNSAIWSPRFFSPIDRSLNTSFDTNRFAAGIVSSGVFSVTLVALESFFGGIFSGSIVFDSVRLKGDTGFFS